MRSNSRLSFQWLLLLVMLTVSLVVRVLFVGFANVCGFTSFLAFTESFVGYVLSLAMGVVVATAVAVNVDPAKAKPAARIFMFPSSRRRLESGTSSTLVMSPNLYLAGRISRAILIAGVLVLVVSFLAQLVMGHVTGGGYVLEGLLLLMLLALLAFSFVHGFDLRRS